MPDSSVSKGLERVYNNAQKTAIELDLKKEKIIIFSDHHRGVSDGADDFEKCKNNYRTALGYYYENGYKLIILGDAEDLWECWPKDVVKTYADSLLQESEFNKAGRYIRIYGNHDDLWQHPDAVKKFLSPLFNPLPSVTEGVVFRIAGRDGQKPLEIFLTHGHQGTFTGDQAAPIVKLAVRYIWRNIQRITHIKLNTPANDTDKIHKHDQAMYNWAKTKNGSLYLITGHTHSPFFSSNHIKELQKTLNNTKTAKSIKKNAVSKAHLENLAAIYSTFLNNNKDFIQCYFNTGCCSYSDGDITGIEIAEGKMRLIKWHGKDTLPKRKILDEFKI